MTFSALLSKAQIQKDMREKEVERLKAKNVVANRMDGVRAHEFYYPA